MAIEDDYAFRKPTTRTGPKAFTEYSFNAIMVVFGLVGSFLVSIGGAIFFMIFLNPLLYPIFGLLMIPGIIGILTIPFGIFQIYFAWKIHTENFDGFQRIIAISWILIIMTVVSAVFSGILILFTLQIVIGQILLNVLVVFFLSKNEVQEEFIWSKEDSSYGV